MNMEYHPLLDSILVVVTTSIAVGLTQASSWFRVACVPLLGLSVRHCVANCPKYITRSAWAASVGGYTLSSFFHYIDVALLSKWSFELQGPADDLIGHSPAMSSTKRTSSGKPLHLSELLTRFAYGISITFSWRFIKSSQEIRNLPQLDSSLIASRSRFLTHTAMTIVGCYLILDVMDITSDPEITAKFFSLDKVGFLSRLSDVSVEEIFMRYFAAIGLGVGLIAVQRGVYSIFAFFTVVTGVQGPTDWPPINGPLSKTYSLRIFWSTFWHQINTHRLYVVSNWLLHRLLRLPRGNLAVRYLRVFIVFILSGILHVGIDFASGIGWRESGALRFFAIQPVGILIEDLFLSTYKSYIGTPDPRASVMQRCFGFLWVGLWIAWTVPAYMYPVLNSTEAAGVVPISVIAPIKTALEHSSIPTLH
ncbi:membrane bound O-acyl transferase family-domain-containing protein [Xylaria arbuscula]|nr:membrane bound O-acyl transferase family-domain-containing protein [Xylaria arbuscula]